MRHEHDTEDAEQLSPRRGREAPLIDRSNHDASVNRVVWWVAGLLVASNITFLGSFVLWGTNQITAMVATQAGYQAGVTEKIIAMDRRLENVERMLRDRE